MTRMNVSFRDSLARELRQWVPTRQRSQFIAEAVQDKLNLLKQERAVRAAAGSWSSEGRSDPEQEIRTIRAAWQDRQERVEGENG